MLFNSIEYIFLFLPITLILYYILLKKKLVLASKILLIFSSGIDGSKNIIPNNHRVSSVNSTLNNYFLLIFLGAVWGASFVAIK